MRYQPIIHAKIYAFLLVEILDQGADYYSGSVNATRVHDIVLISDRTVLFHQDYYRHSGFRTIFQNGQEKILKCEHLCFPWSSR
jgi:hypothetical protein